MEQRWHGNLQQDARALVILLHVGCVEPVTRNVMFGGLFEGLNDDQYSCCLKHVKGSCGYQHRLESLVNILTKADCADYVAFIF